MTCRILPDPALFHYSSSGDVVTASWKLDVPCVPLARLGPSNMDHGSLEVQFGGEDESRSDLTSEAQHCVGLNQLMREEYVPHPNMDHGSLEVQFGSEDESRSDLTSEAQHCVGLNQLMREEYVPHPNMDHGSLEVEFGSEDESWGWEPKWSDIWSPVCWSQSGAEKGKHSWRANSVWLPYCSRLRRTL